MRFSKTIKNLMVLCFGSTLAQSQVQQLDEVILLSQRILSPKTMLSTSLVADSLQLQLGQELGESLRTVPGLFVSSQQNFTQDTRISIRGFGTRAAFGIRGIKILLDGIPITTPDGQTQLDHIPLSQLGSIDLIRGLSGGLYGNASGGVILLKSKPISNAKNGSITLADYNNQSIVAHVESSTQKNHFRAVIEHKKQHGYRQWSDYENTLISLSNKLYLSSYQSLSLDYSFFTSPFAYDSGGLTKTEVEQNRKQARKANLDYQAGERVKQHYLAARFTHNKWKSYAFYTNRLLMSKLPYEYGGNIDLGRHYMGLGTYRNGKKNLWLWQYGIEGGSQLDSRKRYQNQQGKKGNLTLDQHEYFHSIGAFGIVEKKWENGRFRGALRGDVHRITLTDFFDTNSGKTTLSALSPSVAIFRDISTFVSGYLRWSTGFETPSLQELSANPNGETGFNSQLNPQQSNEFELGLKLHKSAYSATLTLFHTVTKNEILPYEKAEFPGQLFYANIGRVVRQGMEIEGNGTLSGIGVLSLSYSYGRYQTENKKNMPNVPQSLLTTTFQRELGKLILAFDVTHVGKRFADNENNVEIPSFWTTNGYAQRRWKNNTVTVGITNMANVRYFDNIRINAFSGRYYEPASERQTYIRVQRSF